MGKHGLASEEVHDKTFTGHAGLAVKLEYLRAAKLLSLLNKAKVFLLLMNSALLLQEEECVISFSNVLLSLIKVIFAKILHSQFHQKN